MKRKSKPPQVSLAISAFMQANDSIIAPALAAFGFALEATETKESFGKCLYGNGTRYVKLYINIFPLDAPNHCNVVLGDGERTMPESDWNSVALWRLASANPVTPAEMSEYLIQPETNITVLVESILNDLQVYAINFLQGDLRLFQAVRTDINRQLQPYKIHKPAEDGTYTTEIEPESAVLKDSYS